MNGKQKYAAARLNIYIYHMAYVIVRYYTLNTDDKIVHCIVINV